MASVALEEETRELVFHPLPQPQSQEDTARRLTPISQEAGFTRHRISWCLDLGLPDSELGKINVCCLSRSVCGIFIAAGTKTGHTANKWQFQDSNPSLCTVERAHLLHCPTSYPWDSGLWDLGRQGDNQAPLALPFE